MDEVDKLIGILRQHFSRVIKITKKETKIEKSPKNETPMDKGQNADAPREK